MMFAVNGKTSFSKISIKDFSMKRVSYIKFILVCIFVLVFVLFIFAFSNVKEINVDSVNSLIWILSLIGWIQFFFSLYTWKKVSGNYFSIYTIFLVFAYLFTYGQCLMWAIGVHTSDEIGKVRLFTLSTPSRFSIVQTQIVTLVGLFAFHVGTMLAFKKRSQDKDNIKARPVNVFQRSCLFQVCRLTSIISTPLMYYSIIRNIFINRVYGYGAALYNADVVATQNNLVLLIRMMFIPSIFGLLISSSYNRIVVRICYINFAIFMILGLFAGDRGEWLFPLFLLIWMHHKYYRKINALKLVKYIVAGSLLIFVAVAVRNTRKNGITVSGLVDSAVGESNPFVSAVFELGNSMRPALIIIQYGWGLYPYGNSYVLAFLGMITERVIMFFKPEYLSLSAWFSQSYLRISYGAGFSFIAEAIMNYGPYGAIIALLIIGFVFSKFVFYVENTDYKITPVKAFFGISTAYSMIQAIRNTLLVATKTWFFSTVLILLFYFVFSSFQRRKANL